MHGKLDLSYYGEGRVQFPVILWGFACIRSMCVNFSQVHFGDEALKVRLHIQKH